MTRLCVVSLVLLVVTVVMASCGGESFRNCSQSYADAYNKVHNYLVVYSRASKDVREYEFVRAEVTQACDEFTKQHLETECMASKQGKSAKVSYVDFKGDCDKARAGIRIPRKH